VCAAPCKVKCVKYGVVLVIVVLGFGAGTANAVVPPKPNPAALAAMVLLLNNNLDKLGDLLRGRHCCIKVPS
jgi:hypothetical protein